MWQLSFGVFFVFFVAQTLVKRRLVLASDVPSSITSLLSYILGIVPLGLLVGLSIDHAVNWSWWVAVLLVIEGLFLGIYSLLSLQAFRFLPTAYFQTIFQGHAILVIILGWLLLSEKLSPLQVIGAAIVLGSALLAIWAPVRAHRKGTKPIQHFKKGVLLTAGSAVAMSIGLVAERATMQYMDLGGYFIVGFMAQGIGAAAIALPQLVRYPLRTIPRTVVRRSALFGILSCGVGFSYLYALSAAGNISLITALKAFGLPLVAIAAHCFLGERDNNKLLWAAILIGVCGVIITAM